MVLLYWVYWDREEQWAGYIRTERMEGLDILGQNINRQVTLGQYRHTGDAGTKTMSVLVILEQCL